MAHHKPRFDLIAHIGRRLGGMQMFSSAIPRRIPLSLVCVLAVGACSESPTDGGGDDGDPPPPTYTVTYDGNGATAGTVPTDLSRYQSGQVVTVLGNPGGLARGMDVLIGWNTASDGSGTSYAPGESFAIGAANVTLFAEWVIGIVPLVPSDGDLGDQFGTVLAAQGDYAIVGARYDDNDGGVNAGSVYVFRRLGLNEWVEVAKLVAPDGVAWALFGTSVDMDGDHIVVGALTDTDSGIRSGSAYVFRKTGVDSWDGGVKLMASDRDAEDRFGQGVAISGDRIVVGAPRDDDNGDGSGSAYVFVRTGDNSWSAEEKLLPADGSAGQGFGATVSFDSDMLVVGAWQGGNGSVYAFQHLGSGSWDSGIKLVAADGVPADGFGTGLSLDGDFLAVGAWFADVAATASGAAYVFQRGTGNSWDSGTKISAADGEAADLFGIRTAISGNHVLVGAREDDDAGIDSGSAYLFERGVGNSWVNVEKILSPDGEAGDVFGQAVALHRGIALIGAPNAGLSEIAHGVVYSRLIPN